MWITWNTASFPCHLLLHFLVHLPDDDLWTTRGTVQRSHMWSWNQSRRWTGNEARFSQVWFLTTEFCQNAKQDGITIGLLPRPNNLRMDYFKYLHGEEGSGDLCGGNAALWNVDNFIYTWHDFCCTNFTSMCTQVLCIVYEYSTIVIAWWLYGNIVLTYWVDKERLLTDCWLL